MIVVDAMVLAYGLLPHPAFVAEVERVRDLDATWAAPPLWRSELRSTLLKYVRSDNPAIVRSDLDLSDAVAVMQSAEAILASQTIPVRSEDVLQLAHTSSCSTYDCEYVALAHALDVPLVTYDRNVLSAFADTALAPTDFVA